jgi:hypothetical protein
VTDPTERPATLLVRWDGAQQQWMLRQNRANASDMPVSPLSPDSIAGRIGPNSRFPISVLAPAPAELVRLLKFGDGTANPAVQVVDSPARADYVLVGRFAAPGRVEYAWALPSTTEEEMKRQVGEAHNFHQSPPLRTRPLRSDWFAITDDPKSLESAGRELIAKANELANIVGWLQLQAPSADNKFPYRLLIKDAATGQASQGELIGEKKYKMFLQRDGTMPTQNIAQRWFYVFVIDCFGKGTLAYPDGANLNNQIPRPQDGGQFPEEIPLNRSDFRVTPPYGTDNYFLLTTSTPIEDPAAIFNFEGARTRAVGKGPVSPLERLISNRSTGTRGAISGIPTDWSIERTSFRSVPPVE